MSFFYTTPNGTSSYGTADSLIQFDDITDDDSLILRDNSDWFIKRVIFEAWPQLVVDNPNNTFDVYRLWTCSIGTIDNDKLAEWVVNQPHTLFEPNGYEMWARMLRTYNRKAYQKFTPKIAVDSASTGALAVETADTETFHYREGAPFSGPDSIYDDFTVSNAGLRPEQSFSIGISSLDPGGDLWANGDSLEIRYAVRVLLQKRRAA